MKGLREKMRVDTKLLIVEGGDEVVSVLPHASNDIFLTKLFSLASQQKGVIKRIMLHLCEGLGSGCNVM